MRISVLHETNAQKRVDAPTNTAAIGRIAEEMLYVLGKESYEIDSMILYRGYYQAVENLIEPGVVMGGEDARFHSKITAESLTVYVLDRRRNEEGNVLPSVFYDNFTVYIQELEDMRYAQQLQMQDNLIHNIFNRGLEDEDDDEEVDVEPLPNLMGALMEAALPRMDARERLLYSLLMVPPPVHEEAPPPGQGGILANLLARLGGAAMLSQQDVKVVCTAADIAKCPIMKFSELPEQLNTACNVCLTDFEPGSDVMQLTGCKHYFHPECITEWLTKSSHKCPVCREPTGKGTPLL